MCNYVASWTLTHIASRATRLRAFPLRYTDAMERHFSTTLRTLESSRAKVPSNHPRCPYSSNLLCTTTTLDSPHGKLEYTSCSISLRRLKATKSVSLLAAQTPSIAR